jgi:hypothetical protein
MIKDKKMIEVSLLQVTELINQQFKNLGDFIGDFLILQEIDQMLIEKKPSHIMQVKSLLDKYAENGDNLLTQYRLSMTNDIEKLMSLLLLDLEKISKQKKERYNNSEKEENSIFM